MDVSWCLLRFGCQKRRLAAPRGFRGFDGIFEFSPLSYQWEISERPDTTGVHRVAEQLIRQLEKKKDELTGVFENAPRIIGPPNLRCRPISLL